MDELDLYEFYNLRPRDNQVIIALAKHFDVPPQNICKALDIEYIKDRETNIMSNAQHCFIVSTIEITEYMKTNYDTYNIKIPGCIVQISPAKEAIRDTLTILERFRATERIKKEIVEDYKNKLIDLAKTSNSVQEKNIGYYTKLESKIPMYYFIKNIDYWSRFRGISDKEFLYKQDDILDTITNTRLLTMNEIILPQLQEAYQDAEAEETPASSQNTTEDTIRVDLENLRRYISRTVDTPATVRIASLNEILQIMRESQAQEQEQTSTPIHLNGDLENIARNLLGSIAINS